MRKLRRFRDRLREDLKDPEFKKAFDEEEIYASLAIQIAKMRQKKKLTQRELARRLHTTQQTVSRLESPNNSSLTITTLLRLAQIFRKKLRVRFV